MTILVVEDSAEQIEIAKKELSALGYKVAVARTLADAKRLIGTLQSNLKGIITDLHFPESGEPSHVEKTADKPNGLAVVARAVLANIPVAVCSDVDHHFCAYAQEVIYTLQTHPRYTHQLIPFAMDRKDWRRAGEGLMKLITQVSQV